MSFIPLGDTLPEKIKKNLPLKKQVEASQVVELVEKVLIEIFGDENSKFAKPLFLKNRTITITCLNSAIAQEIRIHQQEIVDKINDKMGKKDVDRIRYLT